MAERQMHILSINTNVVEIYIICVYPFLCLFVCVWVRVCMRMCMWGGGKYVRTAFTTVLYLYTLILVLLCTNENNVLCIFKRCKDITAQMYSMAANNIFVFTSAVSRFESRMLLRISDFVEARLKRYLADRGFNQPRLQRIMSSQGC